MAGELQIDTILLPEYGLRFSEGYIDFEVKDRTIDRTLVSDFVAIKRVFTIAWDNPISGTLLASILEIYIAKKDVSFAITNADTSTTTYTCRLDIGGEYLREIASGNYAFSGFTITLEEV